MADENGIRIFINQIDISTDNMHRTVRIDMRAILCEDHLIGIPLVSRPTDLDKIRRLYECQHIRGLWLTLPPEPEPKPKPEPIKHILQLDNLKALQRRIILDEQ
jgi:hypothetical protein